MVNQIIPIVHSDHPQRRIETQGVPNLEAASRITRGLNCRQRVRRLRSRGPSVLLHSGLIESRSGRGRFSNGAKEEECVQGLVPSWPRDDSLGPLRGSKTSRSVSFNLSKRHSSFTCQAKSYSCSPILGRSSSSGWTQFSTEVELHEPPRQARSHGNKDSYSGSHTRVDPGERSGETSTVDNLESRIKTISKEHSELPKDCRVPISPIGTISKNMGGTRHCNLRYPRNPRPGLCQSPIHSSEGQDRCTAHYRPFTDEQEGSSPA